MFSRTRRPRTMAPGLVRREPPPRWASVPALATGGLLILLFAALQVWFGARVAHLEHRIEAEQAAFDAAALLADRMQIEASRLQRLLREDTATAAALRAAASSPDALAEAEQRLRGHLPDVIDLRAPEPASRSAPTRTARPAVSIWLEAADAPMLVQAVPSDGADLLLYRDCALLCRPATDAVGSAALRFGHRHWPASPDGGPDPAVDAMANPGFTGVSAQAQIPQAGAAGWSIEVQRNYGASMLLTLLPGMLLLLSAGLCGWWFWESSRARERALMREQEHLAANQRKLEAVLDGTVDGILMVDAEDRISLLNPAAEVMFGQLEADAIGEPLSMLLPESPAGKTGRAGDARVYDCEGQVRGSAERFPARITERDLKLEDGRQRLLLIQDLTEQNRQVEQLQYLEQRDVMTGLLNRLEFERRMTRLLAAAIGSRTPHVLCYIDIDQFKLINDTVGHAAGDALIAQLGKLFEVKFQEAALLGRLGGDEFGALFANRSEAEVLALCEGLLQTVRNFLFTWRDRSYDVAISIGVTAFEPEHESTEVELARADVACHMAKMEGRDRIHVYRDSDASLIRHHGEMHLVSRISEALSGGRFRLFAQAIVPLALPQRGESHHEVLVRMLDEDGALVAPDTFIPAAERYILMPAVDRWVVNQLFGGQADQLRRWHAAHPDEFLYAVNISGTSINDEAFLPYLKRQFELHQVPPASICFEITETAAMRDVGRARRFMDSLAELGCQFALDDFGSGLSSYGYLRELPVQFVKIDGSFVRDMHSNPVNYALVSSINQVAHVLGMKTIAEWAENEYIVNQLRVLNVDYVQGYAVGPPIPITPDEGAQPMPGTAPDAKESISHA